MLNRIPAREGPAAGAIDDETLERMRMGMTVIRLIRLSRAPFTKEELLEINAKLNAIPKAD